MPIRLSFAFIALVVALSACVHNEVGAVIGSDGQPLITIGAGSAEVGGGNSWRAWYFIDQRAHLCAQQIGLIGGHVPCCNLWRLKEARNYLRWLSAEKCKESDVEPEPAPAK